MILHLYKISLWIHLDMIPWNVALALSVKFLVVKVVISFLVLLTIGQYNLRWNFTDWFDLRIALTWAAGINLFSIFPTLVWV